MVGSNSGSVIPHDLATVFQQKFSGLMHSFKGHFSFPRNKPTEDSHFRVSRELDFLVYFVKMEFHLS